MRGKAYTSGKNIVIDWITPAYAGKSFDHSASFSSVRDHPRLCGEKEERNPSDYVLLGSPPPMRGKDTTGKNLTMTAGITPAYAGKSFWLLVAGGNTRDHPRLCGEKLSF